MLAERTLAAGSQKSFGRDGIIANSNGRRGVQASARHGGRRLAPKLSPPSLCGSVTRAVATVPTQLVSGGFLGRGRAPAKEPEASRPRAASPRPATPWGESMCVARRSRCRNLARRSARRGRSEDRERRNCWDRAIAICRRTKRGPCIISSEIILSPNQSPRPNRNKRPRTRPESGLEAAPDPDGWDRCTQCLDCVAVSVATSSAGFGHKYGAAK